MKNVTFIVFNSEIFEQFFIFLPKFFNLMMFVLIVNIIGNI